MTKITATLVKELREQTQAGMMECKKALESTQGDIKRAIEELRKSGMAKAEKRAGRIAAEGVIVMKTAADGKQALMVETNCETDFVARDNNFLAFAKEVTETAWSSKISNVQVLSTHPLLEPANQTVDEVRQALISKVGENVLIRRMALSKVSSYTLGTYLHGDRIGVIVEMDTENKELAKDIAMHIAASKPLVIAPENVSADALEKEKEIYTAQAANSGKPKEIIEKMVSGRVKKFLDEVSLLGQPFVKNPDITVGDLLAKNRAKVLAFTRFEVGEGIEKIEEDFAQAVMSQVQGN